YTPATILMDVPSEFPNAPHPPYRPENNDNKFRGPLSIRQALSNSVNVPAIKALQFAGVQDTIDTAHRMGITSLDRSGDYGLSLTLGGGEIKLLDQVYAYSVFANQGVMAGAPVAPSAQRPGFREMDPVAILRVEDPNGKVLEEFKQPETKQVASPQQIYLITSIISDNQARTMVFAPGGPLELSKRPAAVKTGTTDDWRDTWTVGYTPDIVTGVWVGNSNNRPMRAPLSVTTAAPIWHDFMEEALKGSAVKQFTRPTGLEDVTVCAGSGLLPTPYCPKTVREVFVKGTAPTKVDDFYRPYWIDRRTGGLAVQDTPPADRELQVFQVLPPEAQEWATNNNIPQPPVGASGEYGSGLPPNINAMPSVTATLPFSGTASPGPNTVEVPTLTNLAVAQAEARLNDAGLKLDRRDVWSSTVPEGIVSQQSPPPGTKATRGSVVTLTVSKGVEKVPNVEGLSENKAQTALQQAGFKNYPLVNYQGHDVLPDATLVKVCIGCVLSTTPGPGEMVPPGTEIRMAVRKD
ncbi:MAG: PASTA domain-containing protein, partial [Dehalococcoidia bacterium]|nr:PASTA domain-containing protein [Dehalococcoidia bacterium]